MAAAGPPVQGNRIQIDGSGWPVLRLLPDPKPTLDDLDRFFAGPGVLCHLRGAMTEDSLVRFVITHASDVRTWTVVRDSEGVRLTTAEDRGTDATLHCSSEDFRALLLGGLRPRDGFLDGRLRVEGDVGIVLGLRKAIRNAGDDA